MIHSVWGACLLLSTVAGGRPQGKCSKIASGPALVPPPPPVPSLVLTQHGRVLAVLCADWGCQTFGHKLDCPTQGTVLRKPAHPAERLRPKAVGARGDATGLCSQGILRAGAPEDYSSMSVFSAQLSQRTRVGGN